MVRRSEVNGCWNDNSSSNLSWWYGSVSQHVVVVDHFFLFFIFYILPLIYMPNLKLKKKKKFMSSRVFCETIFHSVFAMRFFLFIIVILSLLINDKYYQNFFNDGVDMLTSKFRHRSIMQPLFKVISTSYIINFKNCFCLLS